MKPAKELSSSPTSISCWPCPPDAASSLFYGQFLIEARAAFRRRCAARDLFGVTN